MNQNNIFSNLSTEGLEQAKDVIGGFGVIESGIYTGTVKAAYAGKSDGGAQFLAFTIGIMVNGQPREYRETVYVTNKQGQNYWERDGKKNQLPGFVIANDVALVTTGYDLAQQEFEEKVVNIYNYDSRSEVPTKVPMATGIVGKDVTLAILKQIESKTKKNEATGAYEPFNNDDGTPATRETNVIDKVFHTESGKTVSEIARKAEGEFMGQWDAKNTGQTRNKVKGGTTGKPGAPGRAAPAGAPAGDKPKSLFGG